MSVFKRVCILYVLNSVTVLTFVKVCTMYAV